MSYAEIQSALEEQEEAMFALELYEYTPESFTPEEASKRLRKLVKRTEAMEEAMRKDFGSHSPQFQREFIQRLAASGYGSKEFWEEELYRKSPKKE